jgi:hypothetical protein
MAKLTLAEFEAHISDQITRIAIESGPGKMTAKQAEREMLDLAKWVVDRMRLLSDADRVKVMRSRLAEALGGRE